MPIIIELIVGELELVEGHDLFHPGGAFRRRIRMDVYSRRRIRVRLARHHPAARVEGVAVPLVVHRDKVHDQHVVLHGVQAEQADLVGGKHPSARLR